MSGQDFPSLAEHEALDAAHVALEKRVTELEDTVLDFMKLLVKHGTTAAEKDEEAVK